MSSKQQKKSYGPYSSNSNSGSVSRSSTATTTSSGSGNSITSSAFNEMMKKKPQQVKNRYLIEQKLRNYLSSTYQRHEWDLYHKNDTFYIIAPDVLTEEILKSCEVKSLG